MKFEYTWMEMREDYDVQISTMKLIKVEIAICLAFFKCQMELEKLQLRLAKKVII